LIRSRFSNPKKPSIAALVFIVKILLRFFFKTVRAILAPILLILDKLTSPKGIVHLAQDLTDQQVTAAACVTGQP